MKYTEPKFQSLFNQDLTMHMRLDNIIKGVLIGIELVIQINKKIFMYNNNFVKNIPF